MENRYDLHRFMGRGSREVDPGEAAVGTGRGAQSAGCTERVHRAEDTLRGSLHQPKERSPVPAAG